MIELAGLYLLTEELIEALSVFQEFVDGGERLQTQVEVASLDVKLGRVSASHTRNVYGKRLVKRLGCQT